MLAMDPIFTSSTIGYRAITSPALQHAAYAIIIAAELAVALLCWAGAVQFVLHIRAEVGAFNRAKPFAVAGLAAGFLLWQDGFIAIGGKWFGMWRSSQWNGVPSAFQFAIIFAAVLIFVAMPDQNADRSK